MTLHEFLYTKKKPQRYYRHVAFWLCSYLPFLLFNIIAVYAKPYEITLGKFIFNQLMNILPLAIDIGYTYVVVYYLIPLYRRTRSVALLASGIVFATVIIFVLKAVFWYYMSDVPKASPDAMWLNAWFTFTNFLNSGSLMRCGLFLGCITLRNYYSRVQEKNNLLQENATAELQLLKAQVHPHFLFNTLNNIYSFSLRKSPVAASLVSKLSDTLQYMITECEAPLVSLNKEIKILHDYVGLESVRYGTRLCVNIDVDGETGDKMIAPLLLIPLVENSFKHGASQMIGKPWIEMKVHVGENGLEFKLRNSKPQQAHHTRKAGIGLRNVQQRLHLLYPKCHRFSVLNEADHFEVLLSIPLTTHIITNNG